MSSAESPVKLPQEHEDKLLNESEDWVNTQLSAVAPGSEEEPEETEKQQEEVQEEEIPSSQTTISDKCDNEIVSESGVPVAEEEYEQQESSQRESSLSQEMITNNTKESHFNDAKDDLSKRDDWTTDAGKNGSTRLSVN